MIEDIFTFDIHGHIEGTIPAIVKKFKKASSKDVKLGDFAKANLNGAVISVIGDINSFRLIKTNQYAYTLKKINNIKTLLPPNYKLILEKYDFARITKDSKLFLLGIEGCDFIERDIMRIENVYQKGVRLMTLIHFSNNSIGKRCMNFKGKEEKTGEGLSEFGKEVVKKLNSIGIVIDLAHCNENTIFDVTKITSKPVIVSHTGPRSLQDFPRYISDKAIKEIAKSGGIIGLWFFKKGKLGIQNLEQFTQYAKYLKKLIGTKHIAIGTDINGVLENMQGYNNIFDYEKVFQALKDGGFSIDEIENIAGLNFFNVLSKIM